MNGKFTLIFLFFFRDTEGRRFRGKNKEKNLLYVVTQVYYLRFRSVTDSFIGN